jgi:hypothetical protein
MQTTAREIAEAVQEAIAAERERCAKIADGWLSTFGHVKPEFVTADRWAGDAVRDIAEAIRRDPAE